MRLIDTHCHLDFPVFEPQRAELLAHCRQLGVERILIPGVVRRHWPRMLRLAANTPGVHCALGLHPLYVAEHRRQDLAALEQRLSEPQVVAVGEIGLDLWEGDDDLPVQSDYFEAQLKLARQAELPVMLHVRRAHDQVLKRLRRQSLPRGGVIHAFSGSLQQADQYWQQGFRLGVGGAVTYSRAQRLRRVLAQMPVEALVLETDAPDMPLCGFQGQPNRPDRLPRILETLAQVRSADLEPLAEQLYANSVELFALSARAHSPVAARSETGRRGSGDLG